MDVQTIFTSVVHSLLALRKIVAENVSEVDDKVRVADTIWILFGVVSRLTVLRPRVQQRLSRPMGVGGGKEKGHQVSMASGLSCG